MATSVLLGGGGTTGLEETNTKLWLLHTIMRHVTCPTSGEKRLRRFQLEISKIHGVGELCTT
jgi:hypothetical protein